EYTCQTGGCDRPRWTHVSRVPRMSALEPRDVCCGKPAATFRACLLVCLDVLGRKRFEPCTCEPDRLSLRERLVDRQAVLQHTLDHPQGRHPVPGTRVNEDR